MAHGIVMRAATIVVVATRCIRQRAAPPVKAFTAPRVYTTTSCTWRARVIVITHICWWWRWRRWWRSVWRGWCRWRVSAFLDGVWRLYGNAAFALGVCDVALHANVARLTPGTAPWVTHDPVVTLVGCAIPNGCNTVINVGSTWPRKNSLLKQIKRNKIYIYIYICHQKIKLRLL